MSISVSVFSNDAPRRATSSAATSARRSIRSAKNASSPPHMISRISRALRFEFEDAVFERLAAFF
jgi:hypothetical protein